MTTTADPDINFIWAGLIVDELIRNGIDTFIICPGSRSAPLALAIAGEPRAKALVHFDERAAAFFATGYATASGKPAVLVCTSGTAAANFLPGIIECSRKKLPLIVITADRPPELRKTGADQAIEQLGIFSEYVRFQFDLPCPTTDIPPAMVLTTVDQAVYRARRSPGGPVHLNCMFREPLAPVIHAGKAGDYLTELSRHREGTLPYTTYHAPAASLDAVATVQAVRALNAVKRGVIVVGKLRSSGERDAVLRLAEKLQWPVFPDVTSTLRLTPAAGPVIHHFDQMLLSARFAASLDIDGVLQVGGRMTSKRLNLFLESRGLKHYVMVLNHPLRNDPSHQVTLRLEAGGEVFCRAVTPQVKARRASSSLAATQALSRQIAARIGKVAGGSLSEPGTARLISRHLPSGHGLFLSNSMPVRDMDMYGAVRPGDIAIGANRGASGIDGIIASAAGFARGLGRPVTLVIGDLAALHDINSLAILAANRLPVTIVVMNNNGGGIFSFLPVARLEADFERLFGTPHGYHFEHAAAMFGLPYARPRTCSEFIRAYARAARGKGPALIEVVTDRDGNIRLHQAWQDSLKAFMDRTLPEGKS